eukprot:7494270-Alexandrium_andersonii.AAC.1
MQWALSPSSGRRRAQGPSHVRGGCSWPASGARSPCMTSPTMGAGIATSGSLPGRLPPEHRGCYSNGIGRPRGGS